MLTTGIGRIYHAISLLPKFLALISQIDGKFAVFDTNSAKYTVNSFDIITYTWGAPAKVKYNPSKCGIEGVRWNVTIAEKKLEDIKALMITQNIRYLWADCLCINQEEDGPGEEKISVVSMMYQYYRSASRCFILMDMEERWDPQETVDDLKFIDHILANMGGASLASEAMLSPNLTNRLSKWASEKWYFPIDFATVRSTAIDVGVLNCYATSIRKVKELFENKYFTRVWTFQEMLLGKNITMYGVGADGNVFCLGQLDTWMDLATESKDKAVKLWAWIDTSRVLKTASVNAILGRLDDDFQSLNSLQTQVRGMTCARTDIINGGPRWWCENHKGVSNVFSAISITPRECGVQKDIFLGLLGIFEGLFTPAEVKQDLSSEDMGKNSFAFFKQLSLKTGLAWTKLAVSNGERGEYDWIPVVPSNSKLLTTDCFAAVLNLGRLKNSMAKTLAITGLVGAPKKYMKIVLTQDKKGRAFEFLFKGCNAGKKVSTGLFQKELIPVYDQVRDVSGDETGRILVQCATVLGSIMDPGGNVVQYRRRLLAKLQPLWQISDPNAKPTGWQDRCNESTRDISCTVRVNCGCMIVAPFSLMFGAITAVAGCSLGEISASLEGDRIILKDGLGLVQVGDVDEAPQAFDLVAFGGDVLSHRAYASQCRTTRDHKPVEPKLQWPRGRALVRDGFKHGITDSMRDYGYFESGGSGNLLICRNNPMGRYINIGVCIDDWIENKSGGYAAVTIK
ncbi:hypothetical protein LZ554_000622 [Drepanopeziza brunnea f. sp. 'monogermtubi']|nr:hypothetical protein LZ554_000622 [Drepanopeziza brunnea f. sp. 'monogermtubi']